MTPSTTTYPVALVDDEMLPLCDNSFSLVFIVHGLEHTRDIKRFLREVWRILTPEGRAIFIVPNRGGLWSTFDTTPFGQGQPYTKSQILKLLKNNMLLPLRYERALFHWTSHRPLIHKTYEITEKVGSLCFRKLSGVIIVDTIKQIYAESALPKKRLILNHSIHTT
jgi:ubiquinone/menaquinone biosynthesis C-methylase UbiE